MISVKPQREEDCYFSDMNGPDQERAVPGEEFQRVFAALGEFSPAQVAILSGTLDRIEAASSTAIVVPGDANDSLYLICSGRARVTLEAERVTVNLGEFGPGQWFGEMAMIEPAPATATVRAVDDCSLLVLPHDRFMALRRSHPDLTSILLQTFSHHLTGRLRETLQHLDPKDRMDGQRGWLLDAARRLLGVAARSAT